MRISNFFRFSNYIQLKNGKLVSRPFPPVATTTNSNKEKDTQTEKDKQKEEDKNKTKEGFPWE